jgi:hypothetical protein
MRSHQELHGEHQGKNYLQKWRTVTGLLIIGHFDRYVNFDPWLSLAVLKATGNAQAGICSKLPVTRTPPNPVPSIVSPNAEMSIGCNDLHWKNPLICLTYASLQQMTRFSDRRSGKVRSWIISRVTGLFIWESELHCVTT